jgi:superfamily II DNA or RNA helicase
LDPRQWQRAAFDLWSVKRRGVVEVVTGGGKTAFAMMCLALFMNEGDNHQVLVLVPSFALLDQWFLDCQEKLGLQRFEIGLLSGGDEPSPDQRIVIAIVNSARKYTDSFSRRRPTMLIVDECHRVGSPANALALSGPLSATLGLSATPEREYDEGFAKYVEPALGDIIFRYSYREAARDGVIAPFTLENVRVPLLPDEEEKYSKLTRSIARDGARGSSEPVSERHKILLQRRAAVSARATMRIPVSIQLADRHQDERVIIFHERIADADQILGLLVRRGRRATAYHSRIGAEMRRENLRQFRKGIFDVLVCCRALDEGLNVPSASVAVIASSTASNRQRIQRLGRILRAHPGKEHAQVYTIFATDPEMQRLRREEKALEGVASVNWRAVGIPHLA